MTPSELLIADIIRQAPRFNLIVVILFFSVLFNSALIFLGCRRTGSFILLLLWVENILLTLAILIACIISVVVLDGGSVSFHTYQYCDTLFLVLFGLSAIFCIVDIGIIFYYAAAHRISDTNTN